MSLTVNRARHTSLNGSGLNINVSASLLRQTFHISPKGQINLIYRI